MSIVSACNSVYSALQASIDPTFLATADGPFVRAGLLTESRLQTASTNGKFRAPMI